MIFNSFWITLTELLVVPGTRSTSHISAPGYQHYLHVIQTFSGFWQNKKKMYLLSLSFFQYSGMTKQQNPLDDKFFSYYWLTVSLAFWTGLGLVCFYGISTLVGYLMPDPLYIYIYIYMICFGWVLRHINHSRLFNTKFSLYIYIKCTVVHRQTCFVLSELFSVARQVRFPKLGSKPG